MERPKKPCTSPGCPNRSDTGRCDRCRGLQRQNLNRRRRREQHELYGGDWPGRRLDYLVRHPYCTLCPRQAAIADHHPRGIRLLRKHGVEDPHDDRYLRPLCKQCHDQETARWERGGWNRDREHH